MSSCTSLGWVCRFTGTINKIAVGIIGYCPMLYSPWGSVAKLGEAEESSCTSLFQTFSDFFYLFLCASPQVSCSWSLIYVPLRKWPHVVPKGSVTKELKCPFLLSECLLAERMKVSAVVCKQQGCTPCRSLICFYRICRRYLIKASLLSGGSSSLSGDMHHSGNTF